MRKLSLVLSLLVSVLIPVSAHACSSCYPGGEYGPICGFNWYGSQWCSNNANQCIDGGGFCVIFVPDEAPSRNPIPKPVTDANAEGSAVAASTLEGPPNPDLAINASMSIDEAYRTCMAQPGCSFTATPSEISRLGRKYTTWGTLKMVYR